jgi:hypothetical protein
MLLANPTLMQFVGNPVAIQLKAGWENQGNQRLVIAALGVVNALELRAVALQRPVGDAQDSRAGRVPLRAHAVRGDEEIGEAAHGRSLSTGIDQHTDLRWLRLGVGFASNFVSSGHFFGPRFGLKLKGSVDGSLMKWTNYSAEQY